MPSHVGAYSESLITEDGGVIYAREKVSSTKKKMCFLTSVFFIIAIMAAALVFLGLQFHKQKGEIASLQHDVSDLKDTVGVLSAYTRINSPVCMHRGECNMHGDCLNNVCSCDDGFYGPSCSQQVCDGLSCLNGGILSDTTCSCECGPGFEGSDCSKITPASPEEARNYIRKLANDSRKISVGTSSAQKNLNLHLGRSVVGITRELLNTQVLKLTYEVDKGATVHTQFLPGNGKSQDWIVPAEIEFTPMMGGLHWGATSTNLYPSWSTYLDNVKPWPRDNEMTNWLPKALRGTNIAELEATLFGGGNGFLTTTQQIYPAYHVKFPGTKNMSTTYTLDPRFETAIEYVSSHSRNLSDPVVKDLYNQLLDEFGERVIVEAFQGVSMQVITHVENTLFGDSSMPIVEGQSLDVIENMANEYFRKSFGQGTGSASQNVFSKHVKSSIKTCMDGNLEQDNCGQDAWKQTAYENPAPIKMRTLPISMFVKDTAVRRNIEILSQQRLEDTWTSWSKQKNCPVCAAGKCVEPNSYCDCPKGLVGRTCTTLDFREYVAGGYTYGRDGCNPPNPVTGKCSCPVGYAHEAINEVYQGRDLIWTVYVCVEKDTTIEESVVDMANKLMFSGMVDCPQQQRCLAILEKGLQRLFASPFCSFPRFPLSLLDFFAFIRVMASSCSFSGARNSVSELWNALDWFRGFLECFYLVDAGWNCMKIAANARVISRLPSRHLHYEDFASDENRSGASSYRMPKSVLRFDRNCFFTAAWFRRGCRSSGCYGGSNEFLGDPPKLPPRFEKRGIATPSIVTSSSKNQHQCYCRRYSKGRELGSHEGGRRTKRKEDVGGEKPQQTPLAYNHASDIAMVSDRERPVTQIHGRIQVKNGDNDDEGYNRNDDEINQQANMARKNQHQRQLKGCIARVVEEV
eukprot:jgi/Bigna1/88043/estExt_fgenesh1_pg.C_270126